MPTLHFPLCLLSRDCNTKDKIDDLIGFAIYNHAKKIPDEQAEIEVEYIDSFSEDYDEDNYDHIKVRVYAYRVDIKIGCIRSIFAEHEQCDQFIRNYELENGKDAWTQFNVSLLFDVRDGKFDYELFSIVCAVNAIIGKKKQYKRITRERIKAAMNGYKSNEIYQKELKQNRYRTNKLTQLPDHTLSRRLIKLSDEGLNFFRRFTYKSRETYYSTRIACVEELMESVIKHKSKRKGIIKQQKEHELLQKYGLAENVEW